MAEPGTVALSMGELRVVARYAVTAAQDVLPLFEQSHPGDLRPRAAGAAAAAAYLHPLAQATQVGHLLRAAAHAARALELAAGGDPRRGDERIEQAAQSAPPTLVHVLRRYPRAPTGRSRVAQLMSALDATLRRS